MSSTVTLPLWLAVLIGVLSVMAALDHLLLPSLRWVMRRRLNRAIDELNTRLKLRIQPFKLAKRQALIDQLVFDPEVVAEIEVYARANGISRALASAPIPAPVGTCHTGHSHRSKSASPPERRPLGTRKRARPKPRPLLLRGGVGRLTSYRPFHPCRRPALPAPVLSAIRRPWLRW
jgi:hypothetical protein